MRQTDAAWQIQMKYPNGISCSAGYDKHAVFLYLCVCVCASVVLVVRHTAHCTVIYVKVKKGNKQMYVVRCDEGDTLLIALLKLIL